MKMVKFVLLNCYNSCHSFFFFFSFFYVFIDFHGLQYSVQQISYKSGQSIMNDQKKKQKKSNNNI